MQISSGALHSEYVAGTNDSVLTAPFHFAIDGVPYWIAEGFAWDGASIPSVFYLTQGTPMDKFHREPSCFHDAVYRGALKGFSRRRADAIYRDWLMAMGMRWTLAWREWVGVRLVGWKYYQGEV